MNINKLAALLGILLVGSTSNGQIGTIRYDHDGENDSAKCIAMDGFGNTYVAGTVTADGDGLNVLVTSYTPGGSVRSGWPKEYNGTGDGDDYVGAIHIDEDGNIYVGGSSYGGSTPGFDFLCGNLPQMVSPYGQRRVPILGTNSMHWVPFGRRQH